MKIHLIHTPEYSREEVENVQGLLASIDGPIEFIVANYEFDSKLFPFLNKYWDDFRFPGYMSDVIKNTYEKDRGFPLSWRELFSLCNHYRNQCNINQHDFVVLLTRRKNALNWFSHGDENNNIFVHTGDWGYYTNAPHEYPVAYSVVENCLQRLMKIDINEFPNPNIHTSPIGCMNDFCQNKEQVIIKLRTGDICMTCLNKLEKENVKEEIITQALDIFEVIRTRLLFHQGFRRSTKPKPVKIGANGTIRIGDKELKLNPVESTLFIFFLTNKEGVALNDLEKHREQLLKIYQVFRKNSGEDTIHKLVQPYFKDGTFSVNKNRLNKKLKQELGEALANFYYLDGRRGETFKINISQDLVSSDIR